MGGNLSCIQGFWEDFFDNLYFETTLIQISQNKEIMDIFKIGKYSKLNYLERT